MSRIPVRWFWAVVTAVSTAYGQGTFENLDFESARIVPVSTNIDIYVAETNALPGWSAFFGANQLSLIPYNPGGGVPFNVGLYGSNNAALSGNFSVALGGSTFLSQAGLVPAGAESLLFEMKILVGARLVLSLGGQHLPYTAISSFPNYTLYGADISAFAGQGETLVFSSTSGSGDMLDNIQFSSQPIPEPTALSLIFLAGGVLVSLRARRRVGSVNSMEPG